MTKIKRIMTVLVAFVMVVSMMAITASADRTDVAVETADTNAQIAKIFPQIDENLISELTSEQKSMLIKGTYFSVEIDGMTYHLNPDNNPNNPTDEAMVVEQEQRAIIEKSAHKFSAKRNEVTLIKPSERISEIERRFGGEVPSILPEEEIDYVLSGGYLKIETPTHDYYFNPDNDPDAPPMTRSGTTYWDVDMGKNGTWYPDTAKLEYKVGGVFSNVNTYIHYDAPGESIRHGRVWTKILGTSGNSSQSQNESSTWIDGHVRAVTKTSVKGDNFATRAYFAYRDLITNWSRSIEIY